MSYAVALREPRAEILSYSRYTKRDMTFNNSLLNSFINYIDATETTSKGYIVCLNQFFSYLKNKDIKNPTEQTIKDYKDYLQDYINPKNNKPLTAGTRQQYLRAVKQFFAWLNSEELYKDIAYSVRNFKLKRDANHKTSKDAFSNEDIKNILNSIDTTTAVGKRDYAIILLAVTGGLRINEISNIDVQDIETIKGEKRVYILAKGYTDKTANYIKLIPAVDNAISDYLKTRENIKPTDALFTSTSNRAFNERITKQSISQIIKKRLRQAGYDSNKLTAHSLRHTSITLLLSTGADILTAQMHARHQDPKTTEIYSHLNIKDDATTEQDVYNQIFNSKEQNRVIKELKTDIDKLDAEQQKKVLNYINQIKEGTYGN